MKSLFFILILCFCLLTDSSCQNVNSKEQEEISTAAHSIVFYFTDIKPNEQVWCNIYMNAFSYDPLLLILSEKNPVQKIDTRHGVEVACTKGLLFSSSNWFLPGDSVEVKILNGFIKFNVINRKLKDIYLNIYYYLNRGGIGINNFANTAAYLKVYKKQQISETPQESYRYSLSFLDSLLKNGEIDSHFSDSMRTIFTQEYNSIAITKGLKQETCISCDSLSNVDVNTAIGRSILLRLFMRKMSISNIDKIGIKEIDYVNAHYTNNAEKNFLLFYCANEMRKRNISEFKKNTHKIYEMFSNPEIKEYFYQNEVIDTLTGNHLLNNKNEKYSFKEILKRNTGKIIYIDFWASWCIPCREEMVEERKIMTQYKDKNIVFIFISIDDNIENWKRASHQENLDKYSDSYLFPNFDNAELSRQLKLTTIPRYVLVGKNGEFINSDAPHPSDKEFQELIEKNL